MNDHQFDKEAWAKMSIFEQMGNIGSEVGRALRAKRDGNKLRQEAAFFRGLDLIDYTAHIWATKKITGLRELLISREQFAESITTNKLDTTLEKYFLDFAIAARIQSHQ